MDKKAINIPKLPQPDASFSRAFKVTLDSMVMLFISGTASIGSNMETLYGGDFDKQVIQAYENVEAILKSECMDIKDVVKWTIFLKSIETYERFEQLRSSLFAERGLTRDSFPASTVIKADLCREELLIELEAIAIKKV